MWVALAFVLFIVSFLIVEYQRFNVIFHKMIMLKKEYKHYIVAYKKIIGDYHKMRERIDLQPDEVEKNFCNTDNFCSVNRDPHYLKEGALKFGRDNHIEAMIGPIYENQWITREDQPTPYMSTTPKRRIRSRRSNGLYRKMRPLKSDVTIQPFEGQFLWPIDRSQFWVSSKFGPRRKGDGTWGYHYGIDMAAPKRTPVKPARDGIVVEASYSAKGYGKTIVIAHDKRFKTRYAHLDQIYVKLGQKVHAEKDIIGCVGYTGNVIGKKGSRSASHLHFEVKEHGRHIDPLYVLV